MSGVIQKFWHETLPVTVLDKLRNTLTLPAFCQRSGIDNGSVFFTERQTTSFAFFPYSGASQYFNVAFTMECWFKTSSFFNNSIGVLFTNSDGSNTITALGLSNGKYFLQILDTFANLQTMTSTMNYNTNKWTHVAITFDGATIRLYQDGVLDSSTLATGAPMLPGAIGTSIGSDILSNKFVGHIAEVRMWDRELSQTEIQYNKDKRKGKNANLKRYYRLNEHETAMYDYLDSSIAGNVAPFTSNSGIEQDSDSYPPLILGGSFVAARFDVSGLDLNVSLKYPVRRPSGANFMLCVAWLENEDDLFFQRRRLWDIDGVKIYPVKPDRYRGEVLPSRGFRFEVWNIDGEEHCEMTEDLVIKLSHVTLPQNQRDIDEPSLGTQVIDYTIFEPFALQFPIQFNTNTWGTCANPLQPDLTLMSDGLTLWGGTGATVLEDTDNLILEGAEGNILDEGGDSLKPEGS